MSLDFNIKIICKNFFNLFNNIKISSVKFLKKSLPIKPSKDPVKKSNL